jgi:tetratricopeptide (TPR) repeat protein
LFVRIEQNLKRKQCDFSSNEPVPRNPVRNESPFCCDFKNRWLRDLAGDAMKLISLCLALALLSIQALALEATPAASPSRFTTFAQAYAEAKRLTDSDPGKVYDVEFSAAVVPRLGEIVGECTKNSGLRVVFDVVFVFSANGNVEQVFASPDQPAASCVGGKLRDLKLSAPPHPDWPVDLHVNISPENAPPAKKGSTKELDLEIKRSPRHIVLRNGKEIATWEGNPDSRITLHYPDGATQEVTITKDRHMHVGPAIRNPNGQKKQGAPKSGTEAESAYPEDEKLAMNAKKAELAKNYEEALKLYEQAINLKGRFTPFVYQNRGMLYLHRAKASTDSQSRIADLQRAIVDFKTSIALGAASDEEQNRGLEKIATKANLEEATKLLAEETGQ